MHRSFQGGNLMSRGRWIGLLLLLLVPSCLVFSPRDSTGDGGLPTDVQNILAHPDRIELLSLQPTPFPRPEPAHAFHDWKVLGRVTVLNSWTQGKIIRAVKKGIADSDGSVAACFNPRHGIRAVRGEHTADLVLCFECNQIYVYLDGEKKTTVLTAKTGQPALDAVLTDAGVPLAPKT
jgi:hypothetical protein